MSDPAHNDRLGQAVRDARLGKRWSVEEAARASGISPTTWKRVENGEGVQDHKLRAVTDALGWPAGHAFRLKAGEELPDPGEVPPAAAVTEDDLSPVELEILRRQDKTLRILEDIAERLERLEQGEQQ